MSGTNENQDISIEMACSHEEAIAEALIFASGSPVKIESIAIALKTDKKSATAIMENLMQKYNSRNGGIMLRKMEKSYCFCSNPQLHDEIRDYFEKPSSTGLSRAAMETLAIIAYNQPVTRGNIEFIRGVNSDGVLVRLIERGLVTETGRSDSPGRPMLYGTTVKFLQSLGLESLSELPKLETIDQDKLSPAKAITEEAAAELQADGIEATVEADNRVNETE
ncbi:MAG: SMC-Scp complex subunit ScpB [Clostridia bacterium]|nr:SMC-Scp complex subunit ScpB [Clostridia bacterium]